jgi:hypothetical protein
MFVGAEIPRQNTALASEELKVTAAPKEAVATQTKKSRRKVHVPLYRLEN